MARSLKHLSVAVLAVVLAFSWTQSAFAEVELAYDDGTPEARGVPDLPAYGISYGAILFSLPSGWSTARLVTFKFYKCADESYSTVAMESGTTVEIHILGGDGVTELTAAFQLDMTVDNAWNTFDLASRGIVVPKDFYVAIMWLRQSPLIGLDVDGPISHRTFGQMCDVSGCHWVEPENPSLNAMGRAEVDQAASLLGPVAGVVELVNKVAVFVPYLALFGVIGAVAVILWKRRDH